MFILQILGMLITALAYVVYACLAVSGVYECIRIAGGGHNNKPGLFECGEDAAKYASTGLEGLFVVSVALWCGYVLAQL